MEECRKAEKTQAGERAKKDAARLAQEGMEVCITVTTLR